MQAMTHFTVGIIIQLLLIQMIFPFGLLLTIIICFFSHFLIDAVAKITYHPPEAKLDDKFWIIYHVILFAIGAFILVWFWNPFWLAMFFATLVDIWDWVFIRGVRYFKKDQNWLEKYRIHPLIDRFRKKCFYWLPNWNEKRIGIMPEILLNGVLLFLIISLVSF
ncbi:MAG: hypothetical protein ACTSVY_14530 [Candidatus Helarchaeota archaeon]